MNEYQLNQMVAQMMEGLKSSTDWMIENQRREHDEHDQRLARAEAVLRRALDFVTAERARLHPRRDVHKLREEERLRALNEKLSEQPAQPAVRERAIEAQRRV